MSPQGKDHDGPQPLLSRVPLRKLVEQKLFKIWNADRLGWVSDFTVQL